MADILTPLVVIAVTALLLVALWRFALWARSRGGAGLMGPFDQMWHPNANESRIEIQEQIQRKAPSAASGDPETPGRPSIP